MAFNLFTLPCWLLLFYSKSTGFSPSPLHSLVLNHHHPSSLAWITSLPPNWSSYFQSCLFQIYIVPREIFYSVNLIMVFQPNNWLCSHFSESSLALRSLCRLFLLFECSSNLPHTHLIDLPTYVTLYLTFSGRLCPTPQGRVALLTP